MSLEELRAANTALETTIATAYAHRADLIAQARADGHTWQEIAEALGMKTQHGAIKASKMGHP
jgi:hypothetical protein